VRHFGGVGDLQGDEDRSSFGIHAMTNPNDLLKTGSANSSGRGAAILEARGIVKELGQGAGKVIAVKGADIALYPGELTLLMGPSGSGKTTLISILGCILSATHGQVTVAGVETAGLSPDALAELRRRNIGYIFQSYNLFPTLTALENVRIALDVAGIRGSAAIEKARSALEGVGLGHRLNSYPGNMSGGEKQRVAVARAIASEPSIVLADEPTAALDSENGHGVMRLLADIAHVQNRSILVVTHDPRTLGYADRVIHIEDGVIVREERRDRMAGVLAAASEANSGAATGGPRQNGVVKPGVAGDDGDAPALPGRARRSGSRRHRAGR
jgi:putative ABC transport system ATP-binding protein